MGWLAFDNIEEALQDSKDILLPFDLKVWTFFAVIILFTGHVTFGFPSMPVPGDTGFDSDWSYDSATSETSVPETSIQSPFSDDLDNVIGEATQSASISPLFLILLVLIPGLLLFLIYVTSVFEFVMYRSVKDKEPKLGYFREYLGEGLQYMIFNIGMALLSILTIVVLILPLTVTLWSALVVIPIGLLLFVILGGISWLVFNIALPEMIYNDKNIIEGFTKSLEILKEETAEVVLFWFMKWAISLLISIGVLTIVVSSLILLAIPFVIIGFLLALISPWLAVPIGIIFAVLVIVLLLYIAVPVRVYLYSYILNMYEDLVQ